MRGRQRGNMESHVKKRRTNILINLTSLLLCQALQEILGMATVEYQTVASIDLTLVNNFVPDMILFDANTLAMNSFSLWPNALRVLIDTGIPNEDIIALLINHKLNGVISTDTDRQLFQKALEVIANGQIWIDNSKLKALIHAQNTPLTSSARETLSKKEREIVLLIAEGRKNKEIAGQLSISEQTVKAHISRIFRKVNATSRSQLVPLALTFRAPLSQ